MFKLARKPKKKEEVGGVADLKQLRSRLGVTLGRPYVTEAISGLVKKPDAARMAEYREMAEEDDAVGPALQFIVQSVMSRFGEYENENEEIADFVNEMLEGLPRGAREFLTEALELCLWAGFSVTELVFELVDGRVLITDTLVLPSEEIEFKIDEETRRLDIEEGVIQDPVGRGTKVFIPPAKCLHLILNPRQGSPYGFSMLKRVYKEWVKKLPINKMGLAALDNQGNPFLVCYWPDLPRVDPDSGADSTYFEIAKNSAGDIYGRGSALHIPIPPEPEAPKPKVEVPVQPTGEAWKPFDAALVGIDLRIMRGLLIPSLLYQEGQRSGSLALGRAHFDFFDMLTSTTYEGLADSIINQIVKPLIQLNFGPQEDYGEFPAVERSPEDIETLTKALLNYVNSGGDPLDTVGGAFLNKLEQSLGSQPEQIELVPVGSKREEEPEEEEEIEEEDIEEETED